MGWKSNVRSVNSGLNELQRSAARRQRELARQQANAAKMAEIDRAAYEVAVFENTIEVITSVHRETPELIDWQALADAPEPQVPAEDWSRLSAAQAQLDEYTPKGLAKVGGLGERKRAKLADAVEEARRADQAANDERRAAFDTQHSDWEDRRRIAAAVLSGEKSGYEQAFSMLSNFADMGSLGTRVGLTIHDDKVVESIVEVHGEDVVPSEIRTQLKSGKLSTKAMPKGRFYETYQDYVCGALLRVANELCALLPIEVVIVTAVDDILDTSTGRMKSQALVSAIVPRETLERVNLELVDPSDALGNVLSRMKFKKTAGFDPVEPFTLEDVPADLSP